MGNGVDKELIHMTHGQEQWCGDCPREWGVLGGGGQRRKIQDNCNSLINKIKFKKRKREEDSKLLPFSQICWIMHNTGP